jgi:hypothetical protein
MYTNTCMPAQSCVCTYVYIHMRMCDYLHVCMYVRVSVVHICIHRCVCVCDVPVVASDDEEAFLSQPLSAQINSTVRWSGMWCHVMQYRGMLRDSTVEQNTVECGDMLRCDVEFSVVGCEDIVECCVR